MLSLKKTAHPAPNLGKNIWHGELFFSVSGIISKFKMQGIVLDKNADNMQKLMPVLN